MFASWRRLRFLAQERVSDWIRTDLARLSVWSPAAIGLGVGVYFSLKNEPGWQAGVVALAVAVAALWLQPLRKLAVAGALAALGFVAADLRTARTAAPVLERELGVVAVRGRLLSVEEGASSRRIIIALESVRGLDAAATPARARISWRGKEFAAAPGDMISVRAHLGPPPPPAAPGGFDFARRLYFQKIGALGFAVSAPIVDPAVEKTRAQKLAARIETMRLNLFRRITSAAPGQGGAIVAAVVTGKRDAIGDNAKIALRDAGLAHLLAISGLHMGLATGLVFFAVRLGLALIEPLALKYPVKKWAAASALLSGFFYLVLSGGGWSARRAFIMTAIIFTAMLFDRRAFSLRNIAIAATVILLTTPEALFHPGFQMSFAAATALIAAYEWLSARANPLRSFAWPARFKRYLVGLAVTDLIAALATAPYALYHFNRVALYSLPANMAAMPLMGFWIAPSAVIAIFLAPVGLDGWAWRASAAGMETVVAIASEVSAWRGAVSVAPQWPPSALLVLTLGGLWLCLSRAPWRLGALLSIPAAAAIVSSAAAPAVFVAASGLNAGVVAPSAGMDGSIVVYSRRRDRFAAKLWEEAAGFDPLSGGTARMRDVFPCDAEGCVALLGEGAKARVAFVSERRALDEDCARADLVVAFFPVDGADWRACDATLIDRRAVWRRGAHAVWIEENGALRVKTVSEARGRRPWTGD